MLKKDLIANNPLGVLTADAKGNEVSQRMGLVISRPGVGKTAILVQIALDNMLQGKQVMHVSVGKNIEKTKSWYDDIINDITAGAKVEDVEAVKFEIIRNRMIMTFNNSTFSRPKLEERLNDLIQQDIFRPSCLVIDGLDFAKIGRQLLEDIRDMQKTKGMNIWFSAVCHRDDQGQQEAGSNDLPAALQENAELFDTVLMLQSDSQGDGKIFLNIIKDNTGCVEPGRSLRLDPTSMVVWG